MTFESDTPTTPVPTVTEHTEPTEATTTGPEFSSKVRFTTITWGLLLLAGGIGVITLASGYVFDTELALISLLAVAGFTLVGGSIVRAIRK